jgi:hypothetical protein
MITTWPERDWSGPSAPTRIFVSCPLGVVRCRSRDKETHSQIAPDGNNGQQTTDNGLMALFYDPAFPRF